MKKSNVIPFPKDRVLSSIESRIRLEINNIKSEGHQATMTAGDIFIMLTDELKTNAEYLDELNEEGFYPVSTDG
ncbi:MAG: hypothetical protein AB2697_22140 [Candidatus Thiodiazotropha endolucinida]